MAAPSRGFAGGICDGDLREARGAEQSPRSLRVFGENLRQSDASITTQRTVATRPRAPSQARAAVVCEARHLPWGPTDLLTAQGSPTGSRTLRQGCPSATGLAASKASQGKRFPENLPEDFRAGGTVCWFPGGC